MDNDINLYAFQNIKIDTMDYQARPYEWDDQINPTKIIKMHTTCPKCSQELSLFDGGSNWQFVNGVVTCYCPNCKFGYDRFMSAISRFTVQPEVIEEILIYKPSRFDILNELFTDDEINLIRKINE